MPYFVLRQAFLNTHVFSIWVRILPRPLVVLRTVGGSLLNFWAPSWVRSSPDPGAGGTLLYCKYLSFFYLGIPIGLCEEDPDICRPAYEDIVPFLFPDRSTKADNSHAQKIVEYNVANT